MPSAAGVRFRVDGQGELARLAKNLKAADPALRRMLTKELKAAAKPVADQVRAEAESMGLHRAAGAVSVRFNGGARRAGVTVAVSSKKAPYAEAINGGSQGRRTVNRHPVFGHDVWVNQPTRPFFSRAIAESSPKVGQAMVDAMARVAREAGFR